MSIIRHSLYSIDSTDPAPLSHNKRGSFLLYQDENFNAWRKKEQKYIGQHLIIHNFSTDSLSCWKGADFFMLGEYDITCQVVSGWEDMNDRISKKGIFLRNRIIKPNIEVRLKSLAFECKVQMRLIGDSSVFIMSRNNGSVFSTSPVVRISKDTSLKGVFIMFGVIDLSSNKFEYKRQVQVPEDLRLQPLDKNYKDLEVVLNDNGDSKIYVSVKSCGKYNPIQEFHTSCDKFLPYFDKSQILIAATGDSIYLNTFSVQQIERNSEKVLERPACCCCTTF